MYETKLEFPREKGAKNKTPSVGVAHGFFLQLHIAWQNMEKARFALTRNKLQKLTNIFLGICSSILMRLCFSQYCFQVSSVNP